MLSTSHRFLFVHVPKTAGNAIQDALRPYADDNIVCLKPYQDGVERFELRSDRYRTQKHSTLSEYRSEYGAEMLGRLFKFTCVRNPWERAISYWFSPHRDVRGWDRDAFALLLPSIRPVRDFLSCHPAELLRDAIGNVDLVIRHEHLEEGFREACRRTGLPLRRLEVRNKGDRRPYRDYYDPELMALVGDRFREEIECFEYEF